MSLPDDFETCPVGTLKKLKLYDAVVDAAMRHVLQGHGDAFWELDRMLKDIAALQESHEKRSLQR